MQHSFDVDVAKECGVHSAILLNHLRLFLKTSEIISFRDDRIYVYGFKKYVTDICSYLTERQIEYALNKLIEKGYVLARNYNANQLNRTLWYAIKE